ncbi:MAG: DUF6588 family protein, partial [bacterium]
LLFVIALCSMPAKADESSVDKAIKAFGAEQVKGYVQPVADIFGANMGAGWYRSAEIPTTGFNISFEIIGMGSLVGDDQKNYSATAPAGYNPSTFKTATIFGGKGDSVVDKNTGLSFKGSDGAITTSILPLAALQVNLGSIYGTQFIFRGLPIPSISGSPSVSYWGAGVRHSISQYLGDEPPVNLALSVNYSRISVGDLITITNFGVGPQVSKKFSIAELYGGIGYEASSMNIKYTPSNGGTPVDITLDGANKFRGTLGLALNLAILHIHADANFGSVTNFSAGLGFGF